MPRKPVPRLDESELASLEVARASLSKIWLISTLLIALLLIAQTVAGHFGNDPGSAWKWYSECVLPTITVIIGALCYTALDAKRLKFIVRRSFLILARTLSGVYLALVLATPLVEPFVSQTPIEWMGISKYWLGPIQGIVASVIGVLFFKAKPKYPIGTTGVA